MASSHENSMGHCCWLFCLVPSAIYLHGFLYVSEHSASAVLIQMLTTVFLPFLSLMQMAKAPSAARSLPSASTSKATISDEEIERQLKALGVDQNKKPYVLFSLWPKVSLVQIPFTKYIHFAKMKTMSEQLFPDPWLF